MGVVGPASLPKLLWGLVTVNFIHHLDWSKGAQTADETVFTSVSVRVFSEEISISVGGLSEEDCLRQCGWT